MPLALSVALVETGCADFVVLSVNPRESPAGGILWDRTLKALCAVPDAEQVRGQCRWPQETGRGCSVGPAARSDVVGPRGWTFCSELFSTLHSVPAQSSSGPCSLSLA